MDKADSLEYAVLEEMDLLNICRICLRRDGTLTSINNPDNDSIKLSDKLSLCVVDVQWCRSGLSSLICEQCLATLRISYNFRTSCISTDQILQKCLSDNIDFKQPLERQLLTPTKFDFSISNHETIPLLSEETQNSEYLHLKHFLDNEEELDKSEVAHQNRVVSGNSTPVSTADYLDHSFNVERSIDIPESIDMKAVSEINDEERNHQLVRKISKESHHELDLETQISNKEENSKFDDSIQVLHKPKIIVQTIPSIPVHFGVNRNQQMVVKKSTGIQVMPLAEATTESCSKKSYACKECGKSYKKSANLKMHMRTHTGEKPFECKYCVKRFYHSSHLNEHIRRHTGEKPYQCTICKKRFTVRGELTMHTKSHTGEKPYGCTQCDRRCLTLADLRIHVRTHTGEKPYDCDMCGKKFASLYILNSHKKTHTGERPYACDICSKTFTQSSHLNVHKRKHTGEKFRCKICDSIFAHPSQLTVHMREHTGKQPYKCTVCEKVCNYASELQVHMMKHTGEKFSCQTCSKQFSTAAYLAEHSRTHTGFRSVLTLTLALNSAEIFGSVRVCLTYWDYYVPWNSRCWRNDYDILDVTGIARTWGFKTSSYTLTLEDGYIISVFRVYKNITQKTPIVLGHGSVTNPFSWVFAGNNSLAYVLGNLGYDIWMMSWRGTIFSKTHVTLSNKDRAYWQFTFHQMGIYDVKSTMDLVYNITQEKAIYIGYSMGTTNSYVYCSILPEHCRQRLLGVVSFAPVGYMLGAKGLFAILWRPFCWHIVRHLTYFFLNGEFLKLTPSLKIVYRILSLTPLMNYIGITLFSFLYGFHIHTLDPTTTPVIFNRFQDTIGIEVYSHYSQNFNNKAFNQFDYGTQKNLELYGQSHPPAYPLDKIPVPVAMFVGRNDYLGTLEATSKMYSLLHSQAQCLYHIVSDPKYCHYDFIIAKHQSVLYEPMLKTIRLMEARTCERLSICSICNRSFTRNQYLVKHLRTHTGEKPYTCDICYRKFTQSSSLKVHIRIHTGERPFSCNFCEKRFITNSDLTSHVKTHKKYAVL